MGALGDLKALLDELRQVQDQEHRLVERRAELVTQARDEGWSLPKLAEAVGSHSSTVSRWQTRKYSG